MWTMTALSGQVRVSEDQGDDLRVFCEDLSEYDYQDEDAFTDRESGF
ncbi:hypothetical protein TNCT6_65730 [Streptomyces sp. 6-11-2]|nr:hypothetical protein TNCT6_65730 [Streptomyces sp. 6-11-2]